MKRACASGLASTNIRGMLVPTDNVRTRQFVAALVATAISGCFPQALVDLFVPDAQGQFAGRFIALFPAQEYDAIEGYLDPELQVRVPDPRSTLMKVAAEFPSGEPLQILTVGASTHTQSGVSVSKLAYEYIYPDAWVVVNIAIKERGGVMTVTSMHAQRREESLAQTNRLTFEGKGPAHFLFSIAAVIILGFTFWAAWLCFHTPIPRRKWLWMLFVLVSVGKLSMDWTTGTMGFAIFGIHLPAANLTRALVPLRTAGAPRAGIPLGAIVFLARRGRWSITAPSVSELDSEAQASSENAAEGQAPCLFSQNVVRREM